MAHCSHQRACWPLLIALIAVTFSFSRAQQPLLPEDATVVPETHAIGAQTAAAAAAASADVAIEAISPELTPTKGDV